MPDKDSISERGRSLEDDYFRRKDRELIEKMRQATAAEDTQRGLGAKTGIQDPDTLKEIAALGFTPETIVLLPLVPLVQVAWVDRSVSDRERALIVELARARGIASDTPADRTLGEWLASPPAPAVFDGATRLIRAMLEAQPDGQRDLDPSDLVRYSEQVANASGGFLALSRVSPEERALLARISAELKGR